jgi:hypothetical protein
MHDALKVFNEVYYRLKEPNGCIYTIFIGYTKAFDSLPRKIHMQNMEMVFGAHTKEYPRVQ